MFAVADGAGDVGEVEVLASGGGSEVAGGTAASARTSRPYPFGCGRIL